MSHNFTSKLTFTVSQVKRFGIQLGDYGTPISTGTTYTLVESADQLCDGAVYIIVGSNATGDEFKAVGAQGKNNRAAEEVTVETDGSIILDNTTNVHSFTLGDTEDGYTLLDNDATSGYLYAAGEAATKQNYLRSSVTLIDNAYWNITFSGSELSIVSVNNDKTPYMQYNSTNSLFSCYNTESQAPVYLYVDETTCTPTPRIIVTPASIEDVDYKGGSFNDLNYELRNLEGESATITFDGEVVVNAMADPEMAGRITYRVSPNGSEEDRKGWIKISAGTVEKVVPVSQHAAPSHEIILEGVSEDGVVYVGPNVNDAASITVMSSYQWTASATCDGVENSFEIAPGVGNPDEEESNLTDITITAKVANDGEERFLGELTIDNGGDEPTFISVWQRANLGDGTLEHPFTVAGVKAYIDEGGQDNVYVAGKISSAEGGIVYPYDEAHGTATFFISDDGNNNDFEAYQVYFFGNQPWVNGNTQIAAGDEVILYGKVTYYSDGSVYETVKKEAYLYSLNGATSETVPTISVTDITDVPAAGVTNATTTVSFSNSDGWTASVTPDNTVVTAASISGTTVTYSVAENTGDTRNGSIAVTLTKGNRSLSKTIAVAQVAAEGQGGTTKTYTVKFLSANMSQGVSGYTGTSFSITDDLTLDFTNFNNNNKQWNYVKVGGKNGAYTGTITTHEAIPEAIKTVTLTIDAITASNVTSIKLYTSNTSSSNFTEVGSFTKAAGDQTVTISNPTANKFYKIEFVCTKGSSNGLCTVSKLVFSNK